MTLLNTFLKDLARFSLFPHLRGQRVLAAVSGGADSLCMLHLLQRIAPDYGITLAAATLDHGLRATAGAQDARFVMATARQWGLPVITDQRDVSAMAAALGKGIEETARLVRYTFLVEAAQQFGAGVIAAGHTADDQAETILMHLIRGTGLAGLCGMQPVTRLSAQHVLPGAALPTELHLIRPLLGTPRAAIDAYCAEHDLQPRQDTTNTDPSYLRNRVRHEVLPLLETLNPGIRTALVRTGLTLADDDAHLQRTASDALVTLLRESSTGQITLDRAGFRSARLDTSTRRGILRQVMHRLLPPESEIGFASLEQALDIAHNGQTGDQAVLPGAVTLTVDYDTLRIARLGVPAARPAGPWLPRGAELPVTVPGDTMLGTSGWTLTARWLLPEEDPADFYGRPYTAVLAIDTDARITVRTRHPGDRFAPLGLGGHSQKLKQTLIDARIPAEQRDTLPLLAADGVLVWIISDRGARISDRFSVRQRSQPTLLIQCQRNNLR